MPVAVITIGPPACGKTRYISRFVGYCRIESDPTEDCLFPIGFHNALQAQFGGNLVIDGCNHTTMQRNALIQWLRKAGYQIKGYFFNVPDDHARLRQNESLRKRAVRVKKELDRPCISEGFDTLETINKHGPTGKAIFFNVDLVLEFGSEQLARVLNSFQDEQGYVLIGLGAQCEEKDRIYQDYLIRLIKTLHCDILDILYCPHNDKECQCRPPKPGLLHEAARRHSIDLKQCLLLGSDDIDIKLGQSLSLISYKLK